MQASFNQARVLGCISGAFIALGAGVLTEAGFAEVVVITLLAAQIGYFFGAESEHLTTGLLLIIWIPAGLGAVFGSLVTELWSAQLLGVPAGMLGAGYVGVLLARHFSQPPEREPGHCPNCGYDLRGLTKDRCPECGEPFNFRQVFGHGRPPQ